MTVNETEGGLLPEARRALAQARRVLDELVAKQDTPQSYRDHLPYVLDRLDNVWRTIDAESKGARTPAFGAWWAEQRDNTDRRAIKELRNGELKRNVPSAGHAQVFKMPGTIRVNEDGSVQVLRDDGSPVPVGPDGTLEVQPAVYTTTRWTFSVPGIEGREVQPTLETLYRRLAETTLPTAERLLSNEPP